MRIPEYHNLSFGTRLKYLRKYVFNLTQIELANKLRVTRGTIKNYEKSISYPDMLFLKRASSFFGVSTDFLIYGDENKCQGIIKKK